MTDTAKGTHRACLKVVLELEDDLGELDFAFDASFRKGLEVSEEDEVVPTVLLRTN